MVSKLTMKKLLPLAFATILALSASMAFRVSPVFAQGTYIGVFPPYVDNKKTPDTFNVKINISSTVPFTAYQFYLYWDRTYLNATALTDTPPPIMTFSVGAGIEWNYNATHGRIERGYMDPTLRTTTGTFQVATITFKVLQDASPPAVIPLDLDEANTMISDRDANQILPCPVYDGNVRIVPEFPVFLIVPLFMALTLVAVILGRKSFLMVRRSSPVAN